MAKRRRRQLLPGEGELGSDFLKATRPQITEEKTPRVIRFLAGYENELSQIAEDYRKDLETGYLGVRQTVSLYQVLTQLRGFWPMSSVDHNGNVYDLSGQGRVLSNSGVSFGMGGIGDYIPVAEFDGAGAALSALDDDAVNLNSMAGGFTVLAWVRPGWAGAAGSHFPVISKGSLASTIEYGLVVDGTSLFPTFYVGDKSHVGTFRLVGDNWNFLAASYDAGAGDVVLQVNANREVAALASPALVATGDDLFIGRWVNGSGNSEYWEGQMTLVALCAGVAPQLVLENVYRATAYMFGG